MTDEQTTPTSDADADEVAAAPGPDEAFCVECGEVIKKRAEICPECGVRQDLESDPGGAPGGGPHEATPHTQAPPETTQNQSGSGLTDRRQYELEQVASKDKTTVALVGLVLTPLAYWMVGKKALAVVNFITFNYFLLGFVIVPIHCYSIIDNAEQELRRAGVPGY